MGVCKSWCSAKKGANNKSPGDSSTHCTGGLGSRTCGGCPYCTKGAAKGEDKAVLNKVVKAAADSPSALLGRTATQLKFAALQWHADAVANHGWPASSTPKDIIELGYSMGSKFEQCRFKVRVCLCCAAL